MEVTYGQMLFDSGISANWVMAGLLAILLIIMKRNGDAADRREKKIDEMLMKQQEQLNSHAIILAKHDGRIDSFAGDVSKSNKDLVDSIFNKIGALNFGKTSRYDKK